MSTSIIEFKLENGIVCISDDRHVIRTVYSNNYMFLIHIIFICVQCQLNI